MQFNDKYMFIVNRIKGLFGVKKEKEQYNKLTIFELHSKSVSKKKDLVRSADISRVQPNEYRKRKGLIGIDNIGNTCYINASIQCLSHCDELTQWLLAGRWEEDVNTVNVIGTEGRLLVEYVRLLHELWRPHNSRMHDNMVESINPSSFKEQLERENSVVRAC